MGQKQTRRKAGTNQKQEMNLIQNEKKKIYRLQTVEFTMEGKIETSEEEHAEGSVRTKGKHNQENKTGKYKKEKTLKMKDRCRGEIIKTKQQVKLHVTKIRFPHYQLTFTTKIMVLFI
jgi:hypothetical protein